MATDLHAAVERKLGEYEHVPDAALPVVALHAVLHLHQPVGEGSVALCGACTTPWPCWTIRTIAVALGVSNG